MLYIRKKLEKDTEMIENAAEKVLIIISKRIIKLMKKVVKVITILTMIKKLIEVLDY